MQENSALGRAMAMVADLRRRCAWDHAQTRATLRPYLVEEVLELDHALGAGDPDQIRQELADFLLHLAWQLVLAEELGEATPDEVADLLVRKMERRHPHLFDLGPVEPWERLKRREGRRGTLDGLPPTLPPLLAAYRLQERAATVGFDWPDAEGPVAKVREELEELLAEAARPAPSAGSVETTGHRPPEPVSDALVEEVGDLLFAVVNLARKLHVPPTEALDRTNRKFRRRFEAVEGLARARGVDLAGAGLEVLDALWDEVKAAEAASPQG